MSDQKCPIFICPKGEYVVCQKHKEKHDKLNWDQKLSNIKVCQCCECDCEAYSDQCGKSYRRHDADWPDGSYWDDGDLLGYLEWGECTYCTYDLYSDHHTYIQWYNDKVPGENYSWEQNDDQEYFYQRQMDLANAEVEKGIDQMDFHRSSILSVYNHSWYLFKGWKDKCDQKDQELQELKEKYDQLYYSPEPGPGYLEAKESFSKESK